MELEITKIGPEGWGPYAQVSPEFVVESVLECELVDGGLGGIMLRERPVDAPYQKYGHDDNPGDWSKRFDLRTWGVFLAIETQNVNVPASLLRRDRLRVGRYPPRRLCRVPC